MKTTGFLVLIAVMAGCSGASSNDSDEGEDSFTCDPGECSGTYLTSYTQLGGDCAPLETQVIRVAGLDDFEGCTERSPTTFSDDSCQVDADLLCPRSDGLNVAIVGTLEQEDDACDRIGGTATFALYDMANALVCSGTYRMRYDRQ